MLRLMLRDTCAASDLVFGFTRSWLQLIKNVQHASHALTPPRPVTEDDLAVLDKGELFDKPLVV